MPRFVFLADESGHVTQEPGLSDLIGPSQYLCMAGCLIDLAHCDSIRIALGNLRDEFRKSKNLHATELSHVQKIHLIRKLLELEIPQFGVLSDK